MGLFSGVFGKETKDFAKKLAQDIARRYPPSVDQSSGKKPSVARLTNILEKALDSAVSFNEAHKLGWMGRARLANHFRWELKELGYSDMFIEVATEGLVIYMSRGPKKDLQVNA